MAAARQAAANTFLPRFRTGYYDPPGHNPWEAIPASIILSKEHVDLAVRAAEESHTLLKNVAAVLPLKHASAGGPKVVGVVGAAANNSHLSIDRYNGAPDAKHISTYAAGIAARAAKAGASVVTCSSNVDPAACASKLKAAGVEVVVVVATGAAEGEQHDRATLLLHPDQLALVKAVHATLPSAKQVLVVVAGGAVSTEQAEPMVDATVWAGKAGMQAGSGFASLLYGDVDFSGRVAATVYREASDIDDASTSFVLYYLEDTDGVHRPP